MQYILNKNSARKDVDDYIKDFSKLGTFTQNNLDELLSNLVQLGIDTYNFSIGANIAAKTINKSIVAELEKYMQIFFEKKNKNRNDDDKAFCAYYLLTYYYRIYEKMDKLSNVITLYQSYFEQREDRYALAYQIRGRLQFALHGGHWCVCQRPPGGAQRPPSLRYFDRLNNNNVMLRCPLHNSVG